MKKLVLVCHASTGSGHKTAAEAIEVALKEIAQYDLCQDYEIKTLDILDFCITKVDGNKAAVQYTGPIAPIHDVTWRYNFTGRVVWGGGRLFSALVFPKFEKYLLKLSREYEVVAAVCTHMMAANVIGGVRSKLSESGDIDHFPMISVPTDYETEGLWPHKQTDLFCVPSQRTIETLLQRKVPDEKIALTGMPCNPAFTEKYDRDTVRRMLNLPLNKTIVVIMAGASEAKPYINFRKEINQALTYFSDMEWMHFVICTGKDKEYMYYLKRCISTYNINNLTVLGYTNQMAALMSASDFALTKAGGMSVTECLCARLPMILVGKAFAQENINVRYLTSIGAAYHASSYQSMIDILCRITSNPDLYRAIKTNTDLVRRPDAAYDIARSVFQMTGHDSKKLPNCKNRISGYVGEARRFYILNRSKKHSGNDKLGVYLGKSPAHTR